MVQQKIIPDPSHPGAYSHYDNLEFHSYVNARKREGTTVEELEQVWVWLFIPQPKRDNWLTYPAMTWFYAPWTPESAQKFKEWRELVREHVSGVPPYFSASKFEARIGNREVLSEEIIFNRLRDETNKAAALIMALRPKSSW